MIAVIVPVHNEEALLAACLSSVVLAGMHRRLRNRPVQVIAVLNGCTDGSREVAERFPVEVIETAVLGVGHARGLGAASALQQGARWLAFTDADSEVPPDWLYRQQQSGCDVVCGCVEVAGWEHVEPRVREAYDSRYNYNDGHRHVHGANLGIAADAYRRCGGFLPLATGEDVALVDRLIALEASISWTGRARVRTSGRLDSRAPRGFARYLRDLVMETRDGVLAPPATTFTMPR